MRHQVDLWSPHPASADGRVKAQLLWEITCRNCDFTAGFADESVARFVADEHEADTSSASDTRPATERNADG